jgi:hypothetical protein
VVIERPVEKIIEVPIEQIIEVPVEKIIEVPVENKIYVERPYEKVIERPYDAIRESHWINEHVLDIDEKDIEFYKSKGALVLDTVVHYEHRDKIVEKPVYKDKIIEQEIKIPKYKTIEIPSN